jgi:hypothetical protein
MRCDLSGNPNYFKYVFDHEGRKTAPITQSGALVPVNAQDCAIGAFISLHGQKRIKNNSDLG